MLFRNSRNILFSLLTSTLLFLVACDLGEPETTGSDLNADHNSDEKKIDWAEEGLGVRTDSFSLSSGIVFSVPSDGLENVKFLADGIDSSPGLSRVLVFVDKENHFQEGEKYTPNAIFAYANKIDNGEFKIVLDADLHEDHKVSFWNEQEKYFMSLRDAEVKVLYANTVGVDIYKASTTKRLAMDAFMSQYDRVDFEFMGDWYSLTLDSRIGLGSDIVYGFGFEEANRYCGLICPDLADVSVGLNQNTVLAIDGKFISISVKPTSKGPFRVQLTYNKGENQFPISVGDEGGSCKSHREFPGLEGICQEKSSCNIEPIGGLCNGSATTMCCPTN